MLNHPIVQVAYFVNDARAAALNAVRDYGAGPFFLVERIALKWGEPEAFLHTSAYGQWGPVMMELVQQDEEGPSPFRTMYRPGEEGIHHMAMMVPDLRGAYQEAERLGYTLAGRAMTQNGTEFAFIDTVARLGHMLEIYERSDALIGFYEMVRHAARDWNGEEPIRVLTGA